MYVSDFENTQFAQLYWKICMTSVVSGISGMDDTCDDVPSCVRPYIIAGFLFVLTKIQKSKPPLLSKTTLNQLRLFLS